MRINIAELKQISGGSTDFSFTEALPEITFQASRIGFDTPVQVAGTVTNVGYGFLVQGGISAAIRLECSRCLEPFALPLSTGFSALFHPPGSSGAEENPTGDDDLEVYPLAGDTIDLTAVVEESIILALPMKPVCRDDCQGLCPQCGQNRNLGSCRCQPEPASPQSERWQQMVQKPRE